jgi:trehalose synthase
LLGNFATDDPEGARVYEDLAGTRGERVLVLPNSDDTALVNTLRRAAVVLQKSLREGFGLTFAEAMWKGTPVIGGNVGGIRSQIEDGANGFLVSSVEDAADGSSNCSKTENSENRWSEKPGRPLPVAFCSLVIWKSTLICLVPSRPFFDCADSW